MRDYFVNPEIKKSSIILLGLMVIFLLLTLFVLRLHHDSLKDDYTKTLGAVALRIIEKSPELESEIMPLITKEISEEEALKGKTYLSEYGLSKNLESRLFPYLYAIIVKNYLVIIVIFIFLGTSLFLLNYHQHKYFYNKMRGLTLGAKRVVEGEYDISISEGKEGDLSKLALSFNSMRQVIRNNIDDLKKEKQFLVDILSDISHQLKTPLSSMIIYNDIMLNKELSKEQINNFLVNDQKQLNRMKWLIKNMLKLARLDANAIDINIEYQSLNETVQESIDALESKATEADVKIKFYEKKEILLEHDRLWLEEALINIIKNGIEHTPKGGEVRIELIDNPVYKRVIVEDTGEGISDDDLPNIFKRFYKANIPTKSESIGIGLALAKSIVELHDGMIEAQSQVGVGTKFIMTFLKY
ncbi:sensor histidine kinase [Brassicibacter mesophilus]|uniref:sensor histidine kinase n=1 Tax=Brassicibacter mesophilus TaxID=745119 RepID=UPI003D193E14